MDRKLRADLLRITLMPERAYRKNAAHIARHFVEDPTKGSKFEPRTTFDAVVILAMWCLCAARSELVVGRPLDEARRLPGRLMQLRWQTPYRLGTCGVIPLSAVPPAIRVTRALRGTGEDAVEVNVVRMEAPSTNALVMTFARDERSRWYLATAYPGILAPPLTDREFWDRHAFVDPP